MPDLPATHDPPGVPLCGDRVPRAGCDQCRQWPDPAYREQVARIRAHGAAFRKRHEAILRRRVPLPRRLMSAAAATASDLKERFMEAVRKRKGG